MFKKGGHVYIYFIYGLHFCLNVVTENTGRGCAVLIRSIIPMEGLDLMKENRGLTIAQDQLANGPAKLVEAMGITADLNGQIFGRRHCPLSIEDRGYRPTKVEKIGRAHV